MSRILHCAAAAAALVLLSAGAAPAADDLLVKIKGNGALRACIAESPPMNMKDPKTNSWNGMFFEMAQRLAATLGVKLEPVDATWGTLVQYLGTGRCDLSIAETFITAQRAEQVLFTSVISSNSQAVFVRADDPAKSLSELDAPEKTIVVISGAPTEKYAKQTLPHATVKPLVTDRQITPLLELASNRADAAYMALGPTLEVLSKNPNLKIRKLGDEPLFPVTEAWMLPLGEYHFQQYVNIWLAELERSGELKKLQEKWLKPQ